MTPCWSAGHGLWAWPRGKAAPASRSHLPRVVAGPHRDCLAWSGAWTSYRLRAERNTLPALQCCYQHGQPKGTKGAKYVNQKPTAQASSREGSVGGRGGTQDHSSTGGTLATPCLQVSVSGADKDGLRLQILPSAPGPGPELWTQPTRRSALHMPWQIKQGCDLYASPRPPRPRQTAGTTVCGPVAAGSRHSLRRRLLRLEHERAGRNPGCSGSCGRPAGATPPEGGVAPVPVRDPVQRAASKAKRAIAASH